MQKINERDIKALKLGAVVVLAVILFVGLTELGDYWGGIRKELKVKRSQLDKISISQNAQLGLLEIVPVFEMPVDEETQKFLFRQKLNEQLKKAGINGDPLEFRSVTKSTLPGYGLLRVQLRNGKGKFDKTLEFLAQLKENPYLAGIEEFSMKCDPKKKQEVQVNLTVSTYVKSRK